MDQSRLSSLITRYERVYFMVSRKMSSLVADQIGGELTVEQHYAIRYLAACGKCTVSELAEALFVKPSAITALMNRLVSRGYVVRIRNEQDRRVVYLSLTALGQSVYQECEEKIHRVIEPYLSKLTEKEIEQFLLTFEKIDQIIKDET